MYIYKMYLFEANIIIHIFFLVYHLNFSVSPYIVSLSFPFSKGPYHFLFYPHWCSGYWSRQNLFSMIIVVCGGENGMHFGVEN